MRGYNQSLFDNATTWVAWQVKWVDTPSWWPELIPVPGHKDIHQFARRIRASSQMPMACYHATKGKNDYTLPSTSHCLNWDDYLPLSDIKFSRQDYRICLPQKTLAYARTPQNWAEKAKLPAAGESCQLAECIEELREAMRPLTCSLTRRPSVRSPCPTG